MGICFYWFYILSIWEYSVLDFVEVIKLRLEKILVKFRYRKKGCNNWGVVICCYRGGGIKKLYCVVDFYCNKYNILVKVVVIEYDFYWNVRIVFLYY